MALSREAEAQTDSFTTVASFGLRFRAQVVLTVVVGNVVRYVDLPISPLVPQAAPGRAWVGIFAVRPHGNVSLRQGWLISASTCFIHN